MAISIVANFHQKNRTKGQQSGLLSIFGRFSRDCQMLDLYVLLDKILDQDLNLGVNY
jgi:hypothetical protein